MVILQYSLMNSDHSLFESTLQIRLQSGSQSDSIPATNHGVFQPLPSPKIVFVRRNDWKRRNQKLAVWICVFLHHHSSLEIPSHPWKTSGSFSLWLFFFTFLFQDWWWSPFNFLVFPFRQCLVLISNCIKKEGISIWYLTCKSFSIHIPFWCMRKDFNLILHNGVYVLIGVKELIQSSLKIKNKKKSNTYFNSYELLKYLKTTFINGSMVVDKGNKYTIIYIF